MYQCWVNARKELVKLTSRYAIMGSNGGNNCFASQYGRLSVAAPKIGR